MSEKYGISITYANGSVHDSDRTALEALQSANRAEIHLTKKYRELRLRAEEKPSRMFWALIGAFAVAALHGCWGA